MNGGAKFPGKNLTIPSIETPAKQKTKNYEKISSQMRKFLEEK